MYSKPINIDFYRLRTPSEWPSFEDILRSISDIEHYDQRNVCINGCHIRLEQLSTTEDLWEGEIVRIRMDELPDKAKLSEPSTPIEMEDDEGIGEATAFLYDAALSILVIQTTRSGVSTSSFCKYFNDLSRQEGNMSLDVVFEPDVIERLQRFGVIRKVELTITGLGNTPFLDNIHRGVGEIIELTNIFQARAITLNLSVRHERDGSLSVENVVGGVLDLMRIDASQREVEAEKISITGKEDEDSPSTILDIVGKTIRSKKYVGIVNRRLPYENRQRAIKSAWQDKVDILRSMYGRASD